MEPNWDQLLNEEMEWGMGQLRRLKGKDDSFEMRVKVIGPNGEIAKTPLRWRDEQEKRRAMAALSHCCMVMAAQAAMVCSDARFLNTPAFCRHFEIPEPTPTTLDAFEKNRRRIMEPYDYYMGNLPPELYHDILMVWIEGPRVKRFAVMPYSRVDGRLQFEPKEEPPTSVQILMLPKWWN